MTIEYISLLLMISVLTYTGSVIGLLIIYRSIERSLSQLAMDAHIMEMHLRDLRIRHTGRYYGTGIPSVAEDTEVAE